MAVEIHLSKENKTHTHTRLMFITWYMGCMGYSHKSAGAPQTQKDRPLAVDLSGIV